AATLLVAGMGDAGAALLLLFIGAGVLLLVAVSFGPRGRLSLVAGLLYAGLAGIALIWMRGLELGFQLILWTMALVWATDILAYFAGRAIGGPKLAPRISPKKTWAGLGGGVLAAAAASALIGLAFGWSAPIALLLLAGALLAIVAQGGDLFESWLKRRQGVKDSGRILPGHGGVMDRVDGLVPVALVVALWQAAAGGPA
ncbi:MAG: phosphatidate cytidylyltransferase, partial [Thermaurantiacus sp.]